MNENISDQELAAEFLQRISADDEDAAFDLAQFCMARVVKKDVEAMLHIIEGLARASAARGSTHAKVFLDEDWAALRAVLLKRLRREFKSRSTKETIPLNEQASKAFRSALNNACGEINEAARLSTEIFAGDELREVRRELARLTEMIDSRVLVHLKDGDAE